MTPWGPSTAAPGLRRIADGDAPPLVFDDSARAVWRGGEQLLSLGRSKLLYRLLTAVAEHGSALDRGALFAEVWEQPYRPPSSDNSLYVAMNRLRDKLDGRLVLVPDAGGWRLEGGAEAYRWDGTRPEPTRAVRGRVGERASSYVGREAELADVLERLRGGARLVSLVGLGGIGKTRLAERVATTLQDELAGGAWKVDLVGCDASGLGARVAAAFGQSPPSGDVAAQQAALAASLARRGPCLLLLDNAEHLAATTADALSVWLVGAPEARILVTSRVRLGVEGEQVVELGGLPLDDAMTLFVDRAEAVRAGVTAGHDEVVRELAERLDGLPLALELAAGRCSALDPRGVLERLDRPLALLARRGRERHDTLRAVLDESYKQLEPWDQQAFAQCSVFEGGFTLEAAEAILALDDGPWTLDVLQALRDRSLLALEEGRLGPRLRMLVPVQAYAAEVLERWGQVDEVRERHAHWFASRGAAHVHALYAEGDSLRHRLWLDAEADNLLAVVQGPDPLLAARAMSAGEPVFRMRIDRERLLGMLDRVVAALPEGLALGLRSQLLIDRGAQRRTAGLHELARQDLAWVREKAPAGRHRGQATCLLAIVSMDEGKIDVAEVLLDEALETLEEAGDGWGIAQTLCVMGKVARRRSGREAAEPLYRRALGYTRRHKDYELSGVLLNDLGVAAYYDGDLDTAEQRYREGLALAVEAEATVVEATLKAQLGTLARRRGQLEEAAELLREGASGHRLYGTLRLALHYQASYAETLAQLGRVEEAVALLEQAAEEVDREAHRPVAQRIDEVFAEVLQLGSGDVRQS